jgi:hypothetical protein
MTQSPDFLLNARVRDAALKQDFNLHFEPLTLTPQSRHWGQPFETPQ